MKKIVVITAHPDDAEIGMGMRIAKHTQIGDKVILVVATGGEYKEYNKSRYNQNKKASKILGITKEYFLEYKCGALNEAQNQLRANLEAIISTEQPDIVYTSFPNDIHVDHEIVSKQAKIASRAVPTLIYFRVVNSYNFTPNLFFFGNADLFNTKIKSIECYKNEVARKGAVNLDLLRLNASSEYYHYYHHSSIKKIRKNLEIADNDTMYCELFCVNNLCIN